METLPIWLQIVISGITFILTVAILSGILFAIGTFLSRHRVIRKYGRYYLVKGFLGDTQYWTVRWGEPDWTYSLHNAQSFPTKDEAMVNMPIGWYQKWKNRVAYKKIRAEQEERLKAHREKMLKVRMDFSNYG